jgi:hypothetical protein
MSRWMMGAVHAAVVLLLVYPLEGASQTATVTCGYGSTFSVATIKNTNSAKKGAVCRWNCIYATKSGGTHINRGAKLLPYLGTKTTKQGGSGIVANVGSAGVCP